jgi:predicted GNAT family acetyltransferase
MTANPVTDNRDQSRFELVEQGQTAFADYSRRGAAYVIPHVETPVALRGHGTAGRLMAGLVELVRADGGRIVPICSYAAAWLQRHPEHQDLIA